MRAEFLIVGQGLAGTTLAWTLLQRGRTFLIVDREDPITSSKIAGGLVTPITGMRLTLNWRYEELQNEAVRFYRHKERVLGRRLYFPRPHLRLLRNEREAEIWERRQTEPELQKFIVKSTGVDANRIAAPFGGFQQRRAGFLDSAAFIEASRAHFQSLGAYEIGEVNEEDLDLGKTDVGWRGRRFSNVVLCQGWEVAKSRGFSWLPVDHTQGAVLSVRAETGETRRILNQGCWLMNRAGGQVLAGSTYETKFDQPHVADPNAVERLIGRLNAMVKGGIEVLGSQTAVRPGIKKNKGAIGRHPVHERLVLMNGLGSKGVLRAPFLARRLVDHLLDGSALEPEIDVQSNF